MAEKSIYAANRLTGGTDGCLDYIDGNEVSDGDCAFVTDAIANRIYVYSLDATSGAAQAEPTVIAPVLNAGTKRWLLQNWIVNNLVSYGVLQGQSTELPSGTERSTTINELSTDGTLAGDSDDATATEKAIKTYADALVAGGAITLTEVPGWFVRPFVVWASDTSIQINGGAWVIDDGTARLVYNTDSLTFILGNTGSNSASTALGNSELHWIYIDDSTLTDTQTEITEVNFLNSTTAPTWSGTKQGWYNGADRCIFMIRTDSIADIRKFMVKKGNWVDMNTDDAVLVNGGAPSNVWTDATSNLGNNAVIKMVLLSAEINYVNNSNLFFLRPNGATGSDNYDWIRPDANNDRPWSFMPCPTDDNGVFEYRFGGTSNNTVDIQETGYILPKGM
jgi:hypothetical protein